MDTNVNNTSKVNEINKTLEPDRIIEMVTVDINEDLQYIIDTRGWGKTHNERGISQIVERIDKRLNNRMPEGQKFSLTTLQKKAVYDKNFWRNWDDSDVRHLIVQGATSAGKTLLSELNILDTLQHGKKAIVIVPLKAMVHEHKRKLEEDIASDLYKVYGASSDYMEYDEWLIRGEYNVAVIVYEKFFAMLSLGNSRIMDDCGLLVVDELSMLKQEQRGAKLEIALEIVRNNHPSTRIMCLATCDCKTNFVKKWLKNSDSISSSARPVELEEHILAWNGKGKMRTIPADTEMAIDSQDVQIVEEYSDEVEVPDYDRNLRPQEQVNKLLRSVLEELNETNPEARILIFVNSLDDTRRRANYIIENAHEMFPRKLENTPQYKQFIEELKKCETDQWMSELMTKYLPYGIALHHSGLSTSMRELIESEFQKKDSIIKAIVATETLTIGVNLPFDTMILTTNLVYRGEIAPVKMTKQEYRNFIGRAGRLGFGCGKGITYLIVENLNDLTDYWSSYYCRDEVESSLKNAPEYRLAPYYLSLLTNKVGYSDQSGSNFTQKSINNLYEMSFAKNCGGANGINAENLYKSLRKANLVEKIIETQVSDNYEDDEPELSYTIRRFGTIMAPYAFSIETYKDILIYFSGIVHPKDGGFPIGLTHEDIESDHYLIDTLYHVCMHKEIIETANVMYPTEINGDAKFKIKEKLSAIFKEKDKNGNHKHKLWCNCLTATKGTNDISDARKVNHLYQVMYEVNLSDEHLKLQATMRAIILYYWTQGMLVEEIREKTGFDKITRLISGDIERLAEIVSFHLDAVYNCLSFAEYKTDDGHTERLVSSKTAQAFYALQTRVKYGMPRDLVILANKHIHGLDRARLLKLRKIALESGYSPIHYLFYGSIEHICSTILPDQYLMLKEAIQRRNVVDRFDMLLEIIKKDATLDENTKNHLKEIYDWNGITSLYDDVKAIMDVLKDIETTTDGIYNKINLKLRKTDNRLCIAIPDGTDKTRKTILNFFDEATRNNNPKIIVVEKSMKNDQILKIYNEYGCDAIVTNQFFAFILASTVMYGFPEALIEALADICGIFTEEDYKKFSLSNYTANESPHNTPTYRLVISHSNYIKDYVNIDKLLKEFTRSEELRNYEIIPWGRVISDDKYTFCDCPTIILLEQNQVVRSKSLNKLIHWMSRQNSKNCILIFTSDLAKKEWMNSDPESCPQRWDVNYNNLNNEVCINNDEVINCVHSFMSYWKKEDYLIGISYPHYDPNENIYKQGWDTDKKMIEDIANALAKKYGEHRILFDKFTPAKKLFLDNQAVVSSLDAYKRCKFYIILFNFWSECSQACIDERELILKRCNEDQNARYLIVQSSQHENPETDKKEYVYRMCNGKEHINDLLSIIDGILGESSVET